MKKLLDLTFEEFIALVKQSLSERDARTPEVKIDDTSSPKTLDTEGAMSMLRRCGYGMSRAKLYKLTSQSLIPHAKFGRKLVFNRDALLEWCAEQTQIVNSVKPNLAS